MSIDDYSPALLIVDDNADNRYTLIRRLKRAGYTDIDSANDGLEALVKIEAKNFDLVLLDIMMPNMDGFQVLEHLSAQGKLTDLPIIVISALDDSADIIRCIELGAEDYLTKPFNPKLLQARIKSVLEKQRLRHSVVAKLQKYVPLNIAETIIQQDDILTPSRKQSTVLYTDIEGFTHICETHAPDKIFEMLNAYFAAIAKPVTARGGTVSQFQGDGMLVTFNVPIDDPQHANHAIESALAIQTITQTQTFCDIALKTRIGIHSGVIVAGSIGSADRLSYTIYGDAINLASQLERLNKEFDSNILISESTLALAGGKYSVTTVGEVQISGRQQAIEAFKLQ